MQDKIKAILELFVEKADELAKEDFTRFLEEFGHQLSYDYSADSQQITMSNVAPTRTMENSFVLSYRMFVQVSEHMRIINPTKPVSPELLDLSLSSQWLEEVQTVAQKIHTFLHEKPTVQMNINLIDQQGNSSTEILTRWDILETLLYGDRAHATQRVRLKNWLSTPYAPMVYEFLMMEFRETLIYTLRGIQHLAYYARIELTSSQSK